MPLKTNFIKTFGVFSTNTRLFNEEICNLVRINTLFFDTKHDLIFVFEDLIERKTVSIIFSNENIDILAIDILNDNKRLSIFAEILIQKAKDFLFLHFGI